MNEESATLKSNRSQTRACTCYHSNHKQQKSDLSITVEPKEKEDGVAAPHNSLPATQTHAQTHELTTFSSPLSQRQKSSFFFFSSRLSTKTPTYTGRPADPTPTHAKRRENQK
jgi:hypothetical protein